jgi:hypothetical protein
MYNVQGEWVEGVEELVDVRPPFKTWVEEIMEQRSKDVLTLLLEEEARSETQTGEDYDY